MNMHSLMRSLFWVGALWALTLGSSCGAWCAQRRVSITISAEQDAVKSGSEIRVRIVLTNTSDQDIVIWRSNGNDQAELSGYTAEVKDAQGNLAPVTKLLRALRGEYVPDLPCCITRSDVTRQLRPNDTNKETLILNNLYDLSKPGTYTVQVLWSDPYGQTKTPVKSNTITVTVAPQ